MSVDLSSVIAATAQWLIRAYPSTGGALSAALAEVQARQAATVAGWLRYPSAADAALLLLAGPGGSERLDGLLGLHDPTTTDADVAWRTWVDEVVASWAACLLADPALAVAAVTAVRRSAHLAGFVCDFGRLTAPSIDDQRAAPLLRHPDLLAPLADLHRADLQAHLRLASVDAA